MLLFFEFGSLVSLMTTSTDKTIHYIYVPVTWRYRHVTEARLLKLVQRQCFKDHVKDKHKQIAIQLLHFPDDFIGYDMTDKISLCFCASVISLGNTILRWRSAYCSYKNVMLPNSRQTRDSFRETLPLCIYARAVITNPFFSLNCCWVKAWNEWVIDFLKLRHGWAITSYRKKNNVSSIITSIWVDLFYTYGYMFYIYIHTHIHVHTDIYVLAMPRVETRGAENEEECKQRC